MPNTDGPNGFSAVGQRGGGTPGRLSEYEIASGYATSIFSGDLVQLVTDGTIELAVAATAGIIGVFQGVQFVNAAGEQKFEKMWTASTTATFIKASVSDDPNELYRCQSGGSLALTDMGANADILTTHAGNATTGRSGQEVSSSTGTGTAQLRLIRIFDVPDNAFGTNVEVIVQINEHRATNRTGI